MTINFLVNDVSYMDYKTQTAHWGWEPTDHRLGGTEESIVRWSKELVKRGHGVRVYYNSKNPDVMGYTDPDTGVVWMNKRHYSVKEKVDITINMKDSELVTPPKTLYLTNETNADTLDLSAYLGVIWPSQWAVDNIPVNNKTFILPHGYDDKKINSQSQKIKKQVLYASSPDRGLDLLAQIWPSVVEKHPDAHLCVTYGGEINTPNTTCGEFTEDEMNELYNTSDIWCYPCTGGELFGISGIKAQAAHAIPVYFPTMAIEETVQSGIPCKDLRDMYNQLVNLLGDEDHKTTLRNQMSSLELPTWETSTDKLLEIINVVV